jgi:hypothetical protein
MFLYPRYTQKWNTLPRFAPRANPTLFSTIRTRKEGFETLPSESFKVFTVKKIVSDRPVEMYDELQSPDSLENKTTTLSKSAAEMGPTLQRNGQRWFDPDVNSIIPFLAPIE